MPKVGRFVVDPNAGAYCQIVLDSGQKIFVNHDKGGFKGGWLGFSSDRIFACALDSPEGQAALAELTRGAKQGSVEATPLGAPARGEVGLISARGVSSAG